MLKSRKSEVLAAIVLAGPFVALYAWMFIYPTIQMVHLSFQNAPLIGEGTWAGLKNYTKLLSDRTFKTAVWNTAYFVLLTVVPGTAVALAIALMVSRLNGWFQSIILAMFFVPYVLPVTVVYILWDWMVNVQFGVLQPVIALFTGKPVNVWRTIPGSCRASPSSRSGGPTGSRSSSSSPASAISRRRSMRRRCSTARRGPRCSGG